MPFKPEYQGELPTLGWYVLDWLAEYLIVPDGPMAGEPLTLTREQAKFVLDFYAVDPSFDGDPVRGNALVNGRYVRRAVLSRPKGWGKSPLLAGLCLAEALADVVPDGWSADGRPVGRSWSSLGFKAKVQVVAVSEDQTVNTWDPLLEMARHGTLGSEYDINPMESFVVVPRGRIEFVTSAATSREGFRPVFSHFDQTESWHATNGGTKLAATIRRNIAKVNGSSIETPNAFVPGEDSVAEKSYEAWLAEQHGKTKNRRGGILFDHREAPADTDPGERRSLMAGLEYAYGESASTQGGWVNLDRIIEDYWDPATDPQDARHFYLNQITHATDSWVSQPEWVACLSRYVNDDGSTNEGAVLLDGDVVTLGFDGSRKRNRGVTDATALIAVRVKDGHVFELRTWEQPTGPDGAEWEVPRAEVDAVVDQAFRQYRVVAMYADPQKWESYVANWEARYGSRLLVKASAAHPIEWWMTGGRAGLIVRATASTLEAIIAKELTHDGSAALTSHVLNARRRSTRSGIQIAKEHPDSPRKIDAAVAMILAWQAYLDAVASGALGKVSDTRSKVIHRW